MEAVNSQPDANSRQFIFLAHTAGIRVGAIGINALRSWECWRPWPSFDDLTRLSKTPSTVPGSSDLPIAGIQRSWQAPYIPALAVAGHQLSQPGTRLRLAGLYPGLNGSFCIPALSVERKR
jgi:hypothetical protein